MCGLRRTRQIIHRGSSMVPGLLRPVDLRDDAVTDTANREHLNEDDSGQHSKARALWGLRERAIGEKMEETQNYLERRISYKPGEGGKNKHGEKLLERIRSDQISRSVVSDSLQPHESQHARPPCPSPTPGVHSGSHPSSQWCHPAISSSVVPFSSCPQSLPASESFPMSQLFARGDQSIGVSALASLLPKNTQDWTPLEWTGWIFLQSKGLSRVFSNTTVQKHQFFGSQIL